MESKLLTLRCNILHQMNEYILFWGDEDIIDEWITIYPDEATKVDLKEIAENNYLFYKCAEKFADCCLDILNYS